MITETAATAVPPQISESIGKLQTEVEKLQQELTQALDVWQSTLKTEKSQFDELLKHKELAWREQEEQWARQSQAYEEKLETLRSEFESRLKQSETFAAHALGELDDAWQRDKLEWGPTARDQWPSQRRELEEKVRSLERALEEKTKAGPTQSTIQALEAQLVQFQQTVTSFQDRAARSDELVSACMQALDYQISVLYDLVHHYAGDVQR